MRHLTIRAATGADADSIAKIYNAAVDERVAVFDTSHRSAGETRTWMSTTLPVLVADDGGTVVGFARLSPYSDHCVDRGIAEHGVYVASGARGCGVGRRLLEALISESERTGLHKITSRIIDGNVASLAAHRAAGFTEVGVQRRHGQIDGEWRDCVLVERLVGAAAF